MGFWLQQGKESDAVRPRGEGRRSHMRRGPAGGFPLPVSQRTRLTAAKNQIFVLEGKAEAISTREMLSLTG